MSTIRIPLNSRKYPGLYALIDEADFELVSQYRWYPKKAKHSPYYAITGRHGPFMHRLILEAPATMQVDHINGDGLDNRRENLRLATVGQNNANIGITRVNTLGLIGVYRRNSGRWGSAISYGGRTSYLGTFDTAVEAARAYDACVTSLRGEFAVTNESLGLIDKYEAALGRIGAVEGE